eukprot:Pgem_evm1s6797
MVFSYEIFKNVQEFFNEIKSESILKIRSKNFESFEQVSIRWIFPHLPAFSLYLDL